MKTSMEATQQNSSIRKKKKENEEEKNEITVNEDRLSHLPDELIHRILSLLNTKLVVQMSVLSKRWRYLWTCLSVLNFDNKYFDFDYTAFQRFVEHVLSHRNASSNVSNLGFFCYKARDDGYIADSLIEYVVPRGIRDLNIFSNNCVTRNLPRLFPCETLTTLKLAGIAIETKIFDFVSLRMLILFDCQFECQDGEILDPFRGCANLRVLLLHSCDYFGKIRRFKIHAPQLTNLSISTLKVDEMFDPDCVIELFTPQLQWFGYDDSDLYDFSIKVNLPFVEKVAVDVDGFMIDDSLIKARKTTLRLIKLFKVMGNAKSVSLSSYIIEVLSKIPALLHGQSSPFTEVQNFELKGHGSAPVDIVDIPTHVMTYLFGESRGFDRC